MKISYILTTQNTSMQQKWGQIQERKTPGKDTKKAPLSVSAKISKDRKRQAQAQADIIRTKRKTEGF